AQVQSWSSATRSAASPTQRPAWWLTGGAGLVAVVRNAVGSKPTKRPAWWLSRWRCWSVLAVRTVVGAPHRREQAGRGFCGPRAEGREPRGAVARVCPGEGPLVRTGTHGGEALSAVRRPGAIRAHAARLTRLVGRCGPAPRARAARLAGRCRSATPPTRGA